MSPSTKRRHERNRQLVAAWVHPIGSFVKVRRARGDTVLAFTASTAFLLDGAHAFIRIEGIPGNTRLDRVTAVFP